MTGSVGIVSPAQTAPQQATGTAAPVPSAPSSAATIVNPAPPPPQSPDTPISPRIVVDPRAGEIIEFLNATGQVQSQIPSAAVVAYLRAGLTSSGFAKPQTVPHSDSKTVADDTSGGTVVA